MLSHFVVTMLSPLCHIVITVICCHHVVTTLSVAPVDVQLLRSVDRVKDQTLFLAQISQQSLCRTMFPVGDLVKSVVKEMALTAGLGKIVKKKEVGGICDISLITVVPASLWILFYWTEACVSTTFCSWLGMVSTLLHISACIEHSE